MKVFVVLCVLLSVISAEVNAANLPDPESESARELIRLAVGGLSHDHVHWILRQAKEGKVHLVGIAESDDALVMRLQKQYGFSLDLVFSDLTAMLDKTRPEAVTAFNMVSKHLDIVEACAPRGIHVMVEKPLAATLQQARKMVELADRHGIHLLTNYETTWYGSNSVAYDLVHADEGIGDLRKIIFKTGHGGPREIGCSEEFLFWLTDPVLNGGGALTDFGCYGANISTWLMDGKLPMTVICVTQQMKPDVYPKVEDEATILLTYPGTQIIIQASWNWSFSRKDMEVYGSEGYFICANARDMTVKKMHDKGPSAVTAPNLDSGMDDPFAYLQKVVTGEVDVEVNSPSSLENNLIVMQILEAAKESSKTGRSIDMSSFLSR